MRLSLRDKVASRAVRVMARLPDRFKIWLSGEKPIVMDGQRLDAQLQFIRSVHAARNHFGYCEPTVHAGRLRARHEALVFRGPLTPVGGVRDFSIPGPGGKLRVRHFAPLDRTRLPLLVYFHGGGFVMYDIDTHDECCRLLCAHGNMHVLSVDYRLAPEHPFPAALEDAEAALRWAQAHAHELGCMPGRIGIGGDSAGGNISAVLSRDLAPDNNPPFAQLLIYPPTDSAADGPSMMLFDRGFFLSVKDRDDFENLYISGSAAARLDARISPLRSADFSKLPRTLIVTAGFDILRDEGEAYAAALQAAGTEVHLMRMSHLVHGFVNMTGIVPAAQRAIIDIARAWRELQHR